MISGESVMTRSFSLCVVASHGRMFSALVGALNDAQRRESASTGVIHMTEDIHRDRIPYAVAAVVVAATTVALWLFAMWLGG
jgi:hypothetical protein